MAPGFVMKGSKPAREIESHNQRLNAKQLWDNMLHSSMQVYEVRHYVDG